MDVQDIDNVTVVTLSPAEVQDDWHLHTTREQLYNLVHAGRRHLVLDLHHLEFLGSSSVLALFIMLQKKLQAGGGILVLRNLRPELHQVFEITRLDKMFNIQKDEQAGLQAF